jgi:arylsulfatase A-like enzyme
MALALGAAGVIVPVRPARAARRREDRGGPPNILFVLADDLDVAEMPYMPEVAALLARHGVTFDDYFVSDSLCCPSRTTTLRGQYAHNTGVLNNGGPRGGFTRAHALGIERHTIATRLQRAGYRTGLFGKYLNGYPHPAGKRYVPPGWTTWASPVGGDPYSEYDYTLNHDRRLEVHHHAPEDYGTEVYTAMARRFIEQSVANHRPFFAFVSVFAPHEPATPAPADVGRFAGATAPRTPSFDQADVSGMPVLVQNLPRFTAEETAAIDRLYQRRIESLQAVDRGVADLVGTLRALGQLKRTFVVFASDNGYHLGQHRLPAGKETPYDTDVRVPLVIRGPGVPAGGHVDTMANNADLAPTFAAMARAGRSPRWDGRSLLAAARQSTGPDHRGRAAQLVEHWAIARPGEAVKLPPPGTVLEPPDADQTDPRLHPTALKDHGRGGPPVLSDHTLYGRLVKIPDYAGVRTRRYLYVEYVNGDRELYDLAVDPDEMHNLAGTRPDVERLLAALVGRLRSCRAAGCRRADRQDPLASLTS